jgi:Flp pilus assembly protein TadG
MIVFVALASFAIDVAHVRVVKSELQTAADAAARAACVALPNGTAAASSAAVSAAAANSADGYAVTLNPSTDITFGIWDPTAQTFTPATGSAAANANAVQIVPVRSTAKGNPVSLAFASVLGISSCDVSASGTACRTGNTSTYSMIGMNGISFSGGGYTDSYNAANGPYSAGSANKKGGIASNGNITLANTVSINGDARCGVGKTTTITGSATVSGLNAPLGAVVKFPSVTLPSTYTNLGDINMSSGTASLPGGTYYLNNLTLSGTANVIWTGPTVLYIGQSYNVSQSASITTYQNLPANRILNFLPTCTTASWTGTNQCVGELYAPDTDFTIGGNIDMYGRVTAKSLTVSGNAGLHYDESLAPAGGTTAGQTIITVK